MNLSLNETSSKMFHIIFAVLMLTLHFVAPLPFMDKCLQVKPMKDFDTQKFVGKWYEILRVNISVPVTTKCHAETYITNGKFLLISGEFINPMDKNITITDGVAAFDPETQSKLVYNFPSAHAVGVLSVIDSDYETYAALYTCNTYEFFDLEHYWILSRKRELSKEIVNKLLSEYKAMGGDVSKVIYIDQTNC